MKDWRKYKNIIPGIKHNQHIVISIICSHTKCSYLYLAKKWIDIRNKDFVSDEDFKELMTLTHFYWWGDDRNYLSFVHAMCHTGNIMMKQSYILEEELNLEGV